jgi:hypothetical protein
MVHEHETEEQLEHVEGVPEDEPANGFHAPAELHVPAAADDADDDSDAPIELEGEGLTSTAAHRPGDDVRADHVTISQSGANRVDARTVTVSQGGVGQVHADELSISQGGIGMARVDSLTVEDGGSAFAVMADTASVEQGASVFLLVARSASGDVRPVLDWRAGLAPGAGVGLVLALLRRFR